MQTTPEIEAFWETFKAAAGVTHNEYVVVSFGDTPAMEDNLAALVGRGTKRATASLLRDYVGGDEPMPRVGDLALVVDGSRAPCCIYRITRVDVTPLSAVDERFAWDEGEGDRTLAWWMDAHHAFFRRQAAREDFLFHDEIEVSSSDSRLCGRRRSRIASLRHHDALKRRRLSRPEPISMGALNTDIYASSRP